MAIEVRYDRLEAIVLARQYKSKTEFRLENKALYSYAHKHGWWPEMSRYMNERKYPVKWDGKTIAAEACNFSRKVEFQKRAPGAYEAARKLGILARVCANMERRLTKKERSQARPCKICQMWTSPDNFAGNSNSCRSCHSKRTGRHAKENPAWKASTVARRRARLARAIPPWVGPKQEKQIRALYEKAKFLSQKTGEPYEVDHIYPIAGKLVCGLHVPENLQVLTKTSNRRKSNKCYV